MMKRLSRLVLLLEVREVGGVEMDYWVHERRVMALGIEHGHGVGVF